MDIHGHHVRGHGRAAIHVRADPGRRAGAGRRVRQRVPPDRVHAREHRTRPAEHPTARQQHAGQRPTQVADRPRLVPPDQPHGTGDRRGRATAAAVNPAPTPPRR